jgi:hypothetical protein
MLTTDELSLESAKLTDKKQDFIEVGKYVVPRIKRRHEIRIMAAIAPFFSTKNAADPAELFNIMYDPGFEDAIIAATLEVDIDTVMSMDSKDEYEPIVQAFNDLNPNFILDIATQQATRAFLQYEATRNSAQ